MWQLKWLIFVACYFSVNSVCVQNDFSLRLMGNDRKCWYHHWYKSAYGPPTTSGHWIHAKIRKSATYVLHLDYPISECCPVMVSQYLHLHIVSSQFSTDTIFSASPLWSPCFGSPVLLKKVPVVFDWRKSISSALWLSFKCVLSMN